METTDQLRSRYTQASDADLRAILNAGTTQLTPEARQALMDELRRRRMLGEINPLDKLAWPAEVPVAPIYPKVSFGTRVWAHIIDTFVPGIPFLGCAIVLGIGSVANVTVLAALGGLGMVCSILWGIYYSFTKDGREGGQSIGKKKCDLMVVNVTTNQPCSKGESALRQLDLFFLQMIPIVGWLVEPIVILASKDGRRLGDRMAGTQVIDVREYRPHVR
jgi:uncharacterized RDD family membrane protein YckC